MKNDRILYLDALRALSIFGVIVVHAAGNAFPATSPGSFEWGVLNVYDGSARFGVPVFIMISGSLFLDNSRELPLKKLFKKNMLRLVRAFIFWSFCYSIVLLILNPSGGERSFVGWLKSFVYGRYHLWFLFALFGLYLVTPLLRKITADKRATQYFLILWLVLNCFGSVLKSVKPTAEAAKTIMSNLQPSFVLGFSGYYVLGYYLKTTEFSKKARGTAYVLGVLGVAATVTGAYLQSTSAGKTVSAFYHSFMPNVCFESTAIFLLFKYALVNPSEKTEKAILKLSELSFGIYLIHDFVNIAFRELSFSAVSCNPLFTLPCVAAIIFAVSAAATLLLRKLPIARKYIL